MGMNGQADIRRVGTHFDRQRRLGHQLAGLVPTMPAPRMRLVSFSNSILVKPSSRLSANARPLAAQGNIPFPYSMPRACASVSVIPPTRFQDRYRPRTECSARRRGLVSGRDLRGDLGLMGALCASMGAPTTSPIAKICGTLVRICLSTAMMPRSLTVDAGGGGVDRIAVGASPTATNTRSKS